MVSPASLLDLSGETPLSLSLVEYGLGVQPLVKSQKSH